MSDLYLAHTRIATRLAEQLKLRVGVGAPQEDWTLPYLFVWGPPPFADAYPLSTADEELMVQVVADSVAGVNVLAYKVRAALEDYEPTIPGWECQPLRIEYATTANTTEARATEPLTGLRPAWLTVSVRFRARRTS